MADQQDNLDPMGLTSHSHSQPRLPENEGELGGGGGGGVDGELGVGGGPALAASSQHQLSNRSGSKPQLEQPPPPIPPADTQVYLEPTTSERIAENFFLVVTLGLASAIWLMALISQAVVTSQLSNATVRTAWFGLVLQLFLILLTAGLLLTTYLPPYHIQISTLAAIVAVFAVIAADANIYSPNRPAQRALAAAWLITAIIDLLWVLYFTSPPQSPVVHVVHSVGPGPAAFKSDDAFARGHLEGGGYSTHRQSRPMSGAGTIELGQVRRASTAKSQKTRGLSDIQESSTMSGVGSGNRSTGRSPSAAETDANAGNRKSGWSLYGSKNKDKEPAQDQQLGNHTQSQKEDTIAGGSSVGRPESQRVVVGRAEAIFNYTAASEDPGELTIRRGEVLEILDRSGKWWEARRADGTTGIAPSNYLRTLE